MKTSSMAFRPGALRPMFIAALLPLLLLLLSMQPIHAGSATWSSDPPDQNLWGDSDNWVPATEPDGPNDTATFGTSTSTFIDIDFFNDFRIGVDGIVFLPGADAFTISIYSATFYFDGVGVANNSGITQNFLVSGTEGLSSMYFYSMSSAGSLTAFSVAGGIPGNGGNRGVVFFEDQSSAGHGSFSLLGGSGANHTGGQTICSSSSTLDHASFTISGGANTAQGGLLSLIDSSSAGRSTLIANGGTTGGAGGVISFKDDSLGGAARVQVFGNGQLDISGHHLPGVTIGALRGSGLVLLGANSLTVGSTKLSGVFSGLVQDGGASGGTGGALVKSGPGRLTLSGANTYTGGTNINQGTLLVANATGSATGTAAVQVNRGTLAGTGNISGAVTVGGMAASASLAPGRPGRTGTLSIENPLTFSAHATYNADLYSPTATADEVVAPAVTISSGAQIAIDDLGSSTLTPGTVFTLISNAGATPIAGTFSNLADNSTLTVGANAYLVSYEGGSGNDLTLTVQ